MKTKIDNVIINQNLNGTYIVFEAGPTHYGIESAKKLAKIAKESGGNAIKFQLLYADRLMAIKDTVFTYKCMKYDEQGNEKFYDVEERAYDVLKRRELKKNEWRELKSYCDEIGITMFTTATFKDEVDFIVDELKMDSIKINSGDVNELEFISYCASKGVNIQIDTGNADIWEIEKAVITCEEAGCENIIIHLCPSGYPAHLESINLKMLITLRQLFPKYAIAFSDHSPGWEMDIAAVALGADMVEKTITLDRTIKSTEHCFSLEKNDAQRFTKSIKELEIALGNSRRTIPSEVREKRKIARRSPYSLKNLNKGDVIQEIDFEFKRPGTGLCSEDFYYIIGKKLNKDMPSGTALTHEYF